MVRTKRGSDRRREEKWQTCWYFRDQQRVCRMAQASGEKLEHTGSTAKKRVASTPQREQLAGTPEPPLPKGKGTEPSVQIVRWERGREASERRSGIGEDERQPVMARLDTQWRRSNLVILVTLKKGNNSGEA